MLPLFAPSVVPSAAFQAFYPATCEACFHCQRPQGCLSVALGWVSAQSLTPVFCRAAGHEVMLPCLTEEATGEQQG